MVLDHVAQHAGLVVVAAALADVDFLGHGDLHVVDVVAVPHRLENRVGEPQHEQVLHRLFAEIVVDAVDLLLAGTRWWMASLSCSALARSVPNGFSMTTRRGAAVLVGQPAAAQLLDGRLVELRRRGEVVHARALASPPSISSRNLRERVEVVGVADVAGVIVDVLGELVPGRVVEVVAGELRGGLGQLLAPLRRARTATARSRRRAARP